MLPKRSSEKSTEACRQMPTIEVPDYYRTNLAQEDVEVLRRLFGVRTSEAAKGLYLSACAAAGLQKPFFRELLFALAAEMEPQDVAEAMLILQMGASQIGVTISAGMMADMK